MSLICEKKIRIVIYAIITIFVSFFAYFAMNNLLFFLAITLLYVIYFVFYEIKYAKKFCLNLISEDDQNNFINNFLMVYMIENDVNKALINATQNASKKLQEEIAINQEYKALEQLEKLKSVFNNYFYQLFVNVIASNSYSAIRYLNEENLYQISVKENKRSAFKKATIEFMILWFFSFVLLIIMRLAIRNYFLFITNMPFYFIAISIYFLLLLCALHLLLYKPMKKEKI